MHIRRQTTRKSGGGDLSAKSGVARGRRYVWRRLLLYLHKLAQFLKLKFSAVQPYTHPTWGGRAQASSPDPPLIYKVLYGRNFRDAITGIGMFEVKSTANTGAVLRGCMGGPQFKSLAPVPPSSKFSVKWLYCAMFVLVTIVFVLHFPMLILNLTLF